MTTLRYTTVNDPWSIGFEGIFRQMEEVHTAMAGNNYPPHNIVKIDDDHYVVELAVAGFSDEELDVQVKDNVLTVTGTKEDARTYVHKGVSTRKFTRSFTLNEHVDAKDATLTNGILSIELERNIPEAERPRKIGISKKDTKVQLNG
jgi:molecular chaperone IbpA